MELAQSSAVATPHARRAQELNLPPPQTFDILPALHELLARIDHSSNEGEIVAEHPDASESSSDIGTLYTDLAPLEPKELPAEVLQIKAKVRNAVKELQKMPDMDRSIEEQQLEIEELEDRIARQKTMIKKLGDLAKGLDEKLK